MKKQLHLGLLLLLLAGLLSAQPPRFQLGLTTGNLLTIPNPSQDVDKQTLIRYQAGLLFRSTLSEKFNLPKPFPQVKKGMAALDYGINFVAKGYSYSFEGFERSQDQWTVEIPLLFTLYDRDDRWLKRKHRRKGYATFARVGPILAYDLPLNTNQVQTNGNFRLEESSALGGFNIFWSVGGGFLRNTKNGNTFSFHISGNVGFLSSAPITIAYADDIGPLKNFSFKNKGSYLSWSMIYLFAPFYIFKAKEVAPPVIFNPRY